MMTIVLEAILYTNYNN